MAGDVLVNVQWLSFHILHNFNVIIIQILE